jgi:hypothetical protein
MRGNRACVYALEYKPCVGSRDGLPLNVSLLAGVVVPNVVYLLGTGLAWRDTAFHGLWIMCSTTGDSYTPSRL